MEILINTDNNVEASQESKNFYREHVQSSLNRFTESVSRIEVYFSDESSNKDTQKDQKCVIEARMKGKNPERVSHNANNEEQAFSGALDKIKTVLDRMVEQQRNY